MPKRKENLLKIDGDRLGHKLLQVAMLLRNPQASAQDLQDLLAGKKSNNPMHSDLQKLQ